MKNSQLFHKTVGILVKAYQNDTLCHNTCHACAVGNIVAGNKGIKFESTGRPYWSSDMPDWQINILPGFFESDPAIIQRASEQIAATGYLATDLIKIESAFENAPAGDNREHTYVSDNDEQWMFNGLMSVVDCLMEIHGANEQECAEAKELFVKV